MELLCFHGNMEAPAGEINAPALEHRQQYPGNIFCRHLPPHSAVPAKFVNRHPCFLCDDISFCFVHCTTNFYECFHLLLKFVFILFFVYTYQYHTILNFHFFRKRVRLFLISYESQISLLISSKNQRLLPQFSMIDSIEVSNF